MFQNQTSKWPTKHYFPQYFNRIDILEGMSTEPYPGSSKTCESESVALDLTVRYAKQGDWTRKFGF